MILYLWILSSKILSIFVGSLRLTWMPSMVPLSRPATRSSRSSFQSRLITCELNFLNHNRSYVYSSLPFLTWAQASIMPTLRRVLGLPYSQGMLRFITYESTLENALISEVMEKKSFFSCKRITSLKPMWECVTFPISVSCLVPIEV